MTCCSGDPTPRASHSLGFSSTRLSVSRACSIWRLSEDSPSNPAILARRSIHGPSNLRDAFGLGVDVLTTPPALIASSHANLAVGMVDGIDLRARNIETLDE